MQGDGQSSEKTFEGEWGLFRMFAAASPNRVGENQYQMAWNVGAATVRATLRPASATNPFERRLFTGLRAPQSPN
jgi:type VI protein secretion system component VasK